MAAVGSAAPERWNAAVVPCRQKLVRRPRDSVTVRSRVDRVEDASWTDVPLEDLPLPKGNRCWPIVGESFEFLNNVKDFGLRRLEKYGQIYRTYAFGENRVAVWGEANITNVVTGDASANLEVEYYKTMRELLGPGALINRTGQDHKKLRQLIGPAFTAKAIAGYVPYMEDLAKKLCEEWCMKGTFPFVEQMCRYAFSVNMDAVLGVDLCGRPVEEVIDVFNTWADGLLSFGINLPFTKFGRAMEARKTLLQLLDEAIDRRKLDRENGREAPGALKAMLDAQDEDGNVLSRDQIKDNLLNILFAGYDTLAHTMGILVLHLGRHPEIWDTVGEEQQRVIKDFGPDITAEALEAMVYTGNVVKEALRIEPIVPTVLRRAKKTFELGGYRIPKGWRVEPVTGYTMRFNSTKWASDADKFRPERFYEEGATKGEFMPFGGGPHMCLGNLISAAEAKVMLAVMARGYKVTVENLYPEMVLLPLPHAADGMPVRMEKLDTKTNK